MQKSIVYVVPKNIYTSPAEGFFVSQFPLPQRNSRKAWYFASKILAFQIPLPLGISNDFPWGGYGFFLELHIQCIYYGLPLYNCNMTIASAVFR